MVTSPYSANGNIHYLKIEGSHSVAYVIHMLSRLQSCEDSGELVVYVPKANYYVELARETVVRIGLGTAGNLRPLIVNPFEQFQSAGYKYE